MSGEVTASAPGKIVLSGEYAVLDGAAAICMAVNRRARAAIADEHGGDVSKVTASGCSNIVSVFEASGDGIRWQTGHEAVDVIDSVWRAADLGQAGARIISLDTSEFVDTAMQRKIGIGSSAAVTVALCAAVNGSADVAALTMVAQRAHASLQAGVGSGVDIACSLNGGLIEYRMEGGAVTTLHWPEGLEYRLIWTGVAASTRDKLSKLDASVSHPSRGRLLGASESMAKAWRSGDAERIISEFPAYCEHLSQFSADHGLGIFGAGHYELWQAARTAGLVYKPCGAGGGDVGVLLGTDDTLLDTFASALPANCSLLDCEMSPAGVRIDG